MIKKTNAANKGLLAVILLCFIGLIFTAFFLIRSMNKVHELESHKKVLINRLAEEVFANRKLQKEVDSLSKTLETYGASAISPDVQQIPKEEF